MLYDMNASKGKIIHDGEKLLAQALNGCMIGERNERCFELGCQLRDAGYSEGEAKLFAKRYADSVPINANDPFTQDEANATIKSAYQEPPRQPSISLKTEKDLQFFNQWHNASSRVRDKRFKGIARAVCNELASLTGWFGGKVRCSCRKLAERTGFCESAVKKARNQARNLGLIRWENLKGENPGRQFSEYELHLEKLKTLAPAEKEEEEEKKLMRIGRGREKPQLLRGKKRN